MNVSFQLAGMEDNIREARAALQSGVLLVINVCECEPELDGSPLNTGGHMQTLVKNAQTPHTEWEKFFIPHFTQHHKNSLFLPTLILPTFSLSLLHFLCPWASVLLFPLKHHHFFPSSLPQAAQ